MHQHNESAAVCKEPCGCGEHNHSHSSGHHHDHAHDSCSCEAHGHDDCGCGHEHVSHDGSKIWVIRLISGIILFSLGFFTQDLLSKILNIAAFLILGYDVVFAGIRNIFKGHFLDENFLMSISSIGAIIIGEYHEGTAVMLFYQIGEGLQQRAVAGSRRSISSLMDIRPDHANLLINGSLKSVTPEIVQIGDTIIIKPGERVPLDCTVTEGQSYLDTSALTGESVPRKAVAGDKILSGSINQNGVLTCRADAVFAASTVSRILDMVENSKSQKAHSELFITQFAKIYTPIVVGLALLIALFPPFFTGFNFSPWIYRALIFLVISCPCALVVSVPLGFFAGIGKGAKHGILFKGSNYLEMLSRLDSVVFDKTGTLTEGVFVVSDIMSDAPDETLKLAALAEAFSDHPIAASIKKAYNQTIDESSLTDYNVISGKGVTVSYQGDRIMVGNRRLLEENHITVPAPENVLGTVVYVAKNDQFSGAIVISDKIKATSADTVFALNRMHIDTVMLTGDRKESADAISDKIGITKTYSELLPLDKVSVLEEILEKKASGKSAAFVGDGINDAPVLARADLGIAMGGIGADSAIEAADIVIMNDDPKKITEGIQISKKTMRIVKQNIIFAISLKIIIMILGAFNIVGMWGAIFADVGVSLLAVCNSVRILK